MPTPEPNRPGAPVSSVAMWDERCATTASVRLRQGGEGQGVRGGAAGGEPHLGVDTEEVADQVAGALKQTASSP